MSLTPLLPILLMGAGLCVIVLWLLCLLIMGPAFVRALRDHHAIVKEIRSKMKDPK